jgi:hypothetical protein
MNVRDIVTAHLKAGGFDGLACYECGCGIADLMPCASHWAIGCRPAKRDGDAYKVAEQPTNEEETHL